MNTFRKLKADEYALAYVADAWRVVGPGTLIGPQKAIEQVGTRAVIEAEATKRGIAMPAGETAVVAVEELSRLRAVESLAVKAGIATDEAIAAEVERLAK